MPNYNLPRVIVDLPLLHEKTAYYIWEQQPEFDDPQINGLMATTLLRGWLAEQGRFFGYSEVESYVDGLMVSHFIRHGPANRDSMIDALAKHIVYKTTPIPKVSLTDIEPAHEEQVA